MADILLPPWLGQARLSESYVDSTGRSVSPWTGKSRTVTLGGDRMHFAVDFTATGGKTRQAEQGALVSFLLKLRGKQNRAYLAPVSKLRGSFPTGELLPDPMFALGTAAYTLSNANVTASASERVYRAVRSSIAADTVIRAASVTTVSGAQYVARVFTRAGKGVLDYRLRIGTTTGGSEIAQSAADQTVAGEHVLTGAATGTSTFFSIVDGVGGRSIDDYIDYQFASFSRCPLSVGSTAAFTSAMAIDALPVSTTGLLLPNDCFEVVTSYGTEYKIVTDAVHSNSSGAGYLQFSPPLRGTLADNSPIILVNPMARTLFVGEVPSWLNEPGIITTASAEFEED
jgi:hypothetical protein